MANKFKKKWLLYIMVGAILMHLGIKGVFYLDDGREEVEVFINESELVKEYIGNPINYTLTKLTNVSKSMNQFAHKVYRFNIKGSTGSAIIIVRVNTNNENPNRFQIISIE